MASGSTGAGADLVVDLSRMASASLAAVGGTIVCYAGARQIAHRARKPLGPRADAASIYRRLYWLRPGFDRVALRASKIAAELFDTGVNMGTGTAVGFLQRALNALNRAARDYPDIAVDREIGPRTLSALDGFLKARGKGGETVLLRAMEALQGERYIALAERRPSQEAFLYGWLANRIGEA